jgi:putative nucleotidyltransferase with HDIG domain
MADPSVAALDAALASALPADSVYAVGGRVRDEVRAELDGIPRPAKDLDYVAVGLTIEELVERLGRAGRADVVGAAFAVVKWTIGGVTVDVALPRRERSTGTGHRDFVVETGPDVPIEDDLGRRDFRMNMLARRLGDGRLVDPYGGEADIHARRIDLVRAEAFDEDPLRMLRAAQFAARLEYTVTPGTLEAMRRAAPLSATVSPERVRDELIKLLGAAQPSIGFEVMREGGILPYVLSELAEGIGVEQNEYHRYDVYEHTLKTLDAAPPDDLVVRLAALLHDIAKPRTKDGPRFYRHESVGSELTRSILERLRFPSDVVERVVRLVQNHMYSADPELSPAAMRRFLRRVGIDNLGDQFALRAADIAGSGLPKRDDANERFEAEIQRVLNERPPLSVKDLAVDGADVIGAAIAAGALPQGSRGGPAVGAVLRTLLDRVIEEPKLNDREALLEMLPSVIRAWEAECSPGNKR